MYYISNWTIEEQMRDIVASDCANEFHSFKAKILSRKKIPFHDYQTYLLNEFNRIESEITRTLFGHIWEEYGRPYYLNEYEENLLFEDYVRRERDNYRMHSFLIELAKINWLYFEMLGVADVNVTDFLSRIAVAKCNDTHGIIEMVKSYIQNSCINIDETADEINEKASKIKAHIEENDAEIDVIANYVKAEIKSR